MAIQRELTAMTPEQLARQQIDAQLIAKPRFTLEQLAWLELIRVHVATSLSIEPEDFDYGPLSQRGGSGRAGQLFGEKLPELLDELNNALAA